MPLQEQTILANNLRALYLAAFMSAFPEISDSFFHNSVYTTTTHAVLSPEFPIQQQPLRGYGQLATASPAVSVGLMGIVFKKIVNALLQITLSTTLIIF